jgi:hypothetical protein
MGVVRGDFVGWQQSSCSTTTKWPLLLQGRATVLAISMAQLRAKSLGSRVTLLQNYFLAICPQDK